MIKINDVLGYSDLKVYQDDDFFAFSLDSIILANYSTIRFRDKKIIDFCTGNAVIPLILSKRCDKKIEGIEVQKSVYDLAKKSVALNNLDDRIILYNDNVINFCNDSSNLNMYDLVLCNPPYFKNNSNSSKNLVYEKMVARHEILINLDQICCCAKKILKEHGTFCLVHRTDRFGEIFSLLKKHGLEPKKIKFVYNDLNSQSNLVLIESQKAGKEGLIIDKPLILFDENGNMTDEYSSLQKEVRL